MAGMWLVAKQFDAGLLNALPTGTVPFRGLAVGRPGLYVPPLWIDPVKQFHGLFVPVRVSIGESDCKPQKVLTW